MRPLFFHFLPQLLDRIVIRRIARQLEDRQALRMPGKEALHRRGCVIPRPILNQHDGLRGLVQHAGEKLDVSFRVEPSLLTLIPGKRSPGVQSYAAGHMPWIRASGVGSKDGVGSLQSAASQADVT